jgi:hypothetical protein
LPKKAKLFTYSEVLIKGFFLKASIFKKLPFFMRQGIPCHSLPKDICRQEVLMKKRIKRRFQMLIDMYIDEEIRLLIDQSRDSRTVLLDDFWRFLEHRKKPFWTVRDITSEDIAVYLERPSPTTRRRGMRLFLRRVQCLKDFFIFLQGQGYAVRNPLTGTMEWEKVRAAREFVSTRRRRRRKKKKRR